MAADTGDKIENHIGRGASAVSGPDFGSYIGEINKLPRLSSSGHESIFGNVTIGVSAESIQPTSAEK